MKGSKHPANGLTLNPSGNQSIHDVIDAADPCRRRFIKTAMSASMAAAFGGVSMTGIITAVNAAPIASGNGFAGIGFESIPAKIPVNPLPASSSQPPVFADAIEVPPGYKVELFAAWGDPVVPGAPAWLPDATQGASEQAGQFGAHNDGMHFFGFPARTAGGRTSVSSERGLLCVNHEYIHEDISHGAEGLTQASVTIAKARKSQAAHGVSVVEARRTAGKWGVVANSPFGRRITVNTPMRISGPAAGNDLMRAKQYTIGASGTSDTGLVNDGRSCQGTLNNCAHGYTPWGTYLTCEENWNGYFGAKSGFVATKDFNRYGVTRTGFSQYWWHVVDSRFDVVENPLEPNRFGYVVEIDPFNPQSTPVKRTALGRFKHESAQVAVSADAQGGQNRVAFYMGDDERNEYVYKFVCARSFDPRNRAANLNLLDEGILYVARFTSTPGAGANTFRGVWIPLVPDTETVIDNPGGGKYKLRDLADFAGGTDAEVQGRICIRTRQAADAVGATMMDRPEWTALRTYFDPQQGTLGYATYNAQRPLEIYCTLTNNNRRGGGAGGSDALPATSSNNPDGTTVAGSARPPVDVANPRPDNDYGHIIRWREDGNFVTATGFEWDIFMLCGDTRTAKTLAGNYFGTNLVPGSGSGPFYQGNIVDTPDGSADLGAPDGLWFDDFGRMWIQTDQQGDGTGDWVNIGANVMACADPNTKQVRRFLTSPPNCEVTGVVSTPDGKTMWVGIQHPGEEALKDDPAKFSNWPRSQFATNSAGQPVAGVHPVNPAQRQLSRPRSAVVVITRDDGGVIGGL